MDKQNGKASGGDLPAIKGVSTLGGGKKIHPLSKGAAEFLSKMNKKKAGPDEIANLLEQWLNND